MTPPYSTALTSAIHLADQIARRHSSSIQWSSWHLWDYLHHNPTPSPQTSIWDSTYPFASCSGFCYLIAKNLAATLEATAGLTHFASQVQILASWEKNPLAPEEDARPRHCVVALLAEEACVLVDLVYSPTVIVVPAEGVYETMPYITMSGRRGLRIFYYDGQQLEMANPKRDVVFKDPFRPITALEALCQISVPAAIKTLPDTKIPMNKMIIVRGIVRETPTKVPSTQMDV